jgi:hypothetical protein
MFVNIKDTTFNNTILQKNSLYAIETVNRNYTGIYLGYNKYIFLFYDKANSQILILQKDTVIEISHTTVSY